MSTLAERIESALSGQGCLNPSVDAGEIVAIIQEQITKPEAPTVPPGATPMNFRVGGLQLSPIDPPRPPAGHQEANPAPVPEKGLGKLVYDYGVAHRELGELISTAAQSKSKWDAQILVCERLRLALLAAIPPSPPALSIARVDLPDFVKTHDALFAAIEAGISAVDNADAGIQTLAAGAAGHVMKAFPRIQLRPAPPPAVIPAPAKLAEVLERLRDLRDYLHTIPPELRNDATYLAKSKVRICISDLGNTPKATPAPAPLEGAQPTDAATMRNALVSAFFAMGRAGANADVNHPLRKDWEAARAVIVATDPPPSSADLTREDEIAKVIQDIPGWEPSSSEIANAILTAFPNLILHPAPLGGVETAQIGDRAFAVDLWKIDLVMQDFPVPAEATQAWERIRGMIYALPGDPTQAQPAPSTPGEKA